MRAVIYAAKSTEDTRGSIGTQLEDCRALARDMEIVGEYRDEAKSAFKGNRGSGLERAMAECARLAREHGGCALIVQHSDRLARGDGKLAKHLVQYALWAIEHDVTIRSVQDPQTFSSDGLVYAALMGDRNTEDSKRKGKSVRDGLKRRADRGQPVGAVPVGFKAEATVVAGVAITERVIDPGKLPTVMRMFELAVKRSTPGEVSRMLNTEGHTTIRGKPWTTRAVRDVLRNEDYTGRNGYPRIIEAEHFDTVHRWLSESQRRWGSAPGRPPASDFPLAGIAVCSLCGAAMRSRRCSTTGRRTYRCSNAMEGRNLCPESVPIPANAAEATFIRTMPYAGQNLDAILAEQVGDRHRAQSERKAALKRLQAQLRRRDGTRDKLLADYRRQIEDGRTTAYLVLEQVERIDGERAGAEQAVRDAEAVVSEHADQPDVDDVRHLFTRLFAFAQEQVEEASTLAELGAVARRLVERVELGTIEGHLDVQSTLRVVDNPQLTFV